MVLLLCQLKDRWVSELETFEVEKSQLENELSHGNTISDPHMFKRLDELENLKKKIDLYVTEIEGIRKWIQDSEDAIVELQGEVKERRRKEESECLFNEAMKDGHVRLRINNVLLSGVAGSGKTCLKLLLTNQSPPEQRNSTSCLNKPVRVNIRPVSSYKYQSTEKGWVEISQEKLLSLLAQIVTEHPKDATIGTKATEKIHQSRGNSSTEGNNKHQAHCSQQPVIDKAIDEVIEKVVLEVTQELKNLPNQDPPSSIKDQGERFVSSWVYITDCGGQQRFHDISPLFIQHISVAVIVVRLTDNFSSFPLDEYYKNGQLVGIPHASHMTLEETLKCLIRSIESHSSEEVKPKLMFVGTFLDQLLSMVTLSLKNDEVLNILSANLKKQVVYHKGFEHPIFAINTLSREEDTLTIADKIRENIERCVPLEIKLPVWWWFLDLGLQNLASALKRGVLSIRECYLLAVRFGFQQKDLEAALLIFDKLCIAHYYPSLLPDTVFVNAQTPLDKITELTEYAIALRNSKARGTIDGEQKRFVEEGVITLESLKQFKNKHYVEDIFSPEDMLQIMKKLLVIAPVPLMGDQDCPDKAEFFMPSLLMSIPSAELEKYFVPSRTAFVSPIAIYFPNECIYSGVFCCLVVYLIKKLAWKVFLPSGEPVLLAKNCVKFRIPNHTCIITLIDSFSLIEVHIQGPKQVNFSKLCPEIQEQVLKGIGEACNALHYSNDSPPEVGIFCPCIERARHLKKHVAVVDQINGFWSCSIQEGVWGTLSSKHKVWYGINCIDPPTLLNDHHQPKKARNNEVVSLSVQAEGASLTYQWLKDGDPLREGQDHCRGVTTPTLTINSASLKHKGAYHCVVSNEEGQVHSQSQMLTVVVPPSIKFNHPQDKVVKSKQSVTLAVQAEGTDLSYQWLKNGDPLREGDRHYHGVTTPSLTISQASLENSGEYQCMVENEEEAVMSNLFSVTVDTGWRWTSMRCSWQVLIFISLCLPFLAASVLRILFMQNVIVCEKLPSLENGQVIYIPGSYSLTNGTLAVYLCDEGFALNGSPIRMCVVGDSVTKGTWTSTSPLCLRGSGVKSQNTHIVESVQDLVKMLSDIGNWEALCTNLGVKQAVMSELIYSPLDLSIKKKRCLESYFDSGRARWEEVIAAVVGPGIFNERVAKKIADKYLLDYKHILDEHEL